MNGQEYDAACKRAATAQGLDPIVDALTDARLPHEIWQTGGMTMVVGIRGEDPGRFIMVNRWEEYSGEEGDGWLIGLYVGEDEECAQSWDDVAPADGPAIIRAALAPGAPTTAPWLDPRRI